MRKLALVVAALGLAGVLLLGGAVAAVSAAGGVAGLSPGSGIPAELLPSIEGAAGSYCDLPPALLAAVLKVESDFDNRAVNPRSGAFTMAQFLPGTWEEWKVNGNPDRGPRSTQPTSPTSSSAPPTTSAAWAPAPPTPSGSPWPPTTLALARSRRPAASRTRPTAPRATLPAAADAARPPTPSPRCCGGRPPMPPTRPWSCPPATYSPG